jgi:hypothetical protein
MKQEENHLLELARSDTGLYFFLAAVGLTGSPVAVFFDIQGAGAALWVVGMIGIVNLWILSRGKLP